MDEHSDLDDWELLSDSGEASSVVVASIESNYFSLNFTEPSETMVMEEKREEEKREDLFRDPMFCVSDDRGSALVNVQESRNGEPIEMVNDNEDAASIKEQSPMDVGIAEDFSSEDGVDLGGFVEELGSSELEKVEGGAEDGVDLGGIDRELNSSEPEKVEVEAGDEEVLGGVDWELNSSEPEVVVVGAEDGGSGCDSGSNGLPVAEKKDEGMVWWRVPLEMVKHCASNVSPVWCLPLAATVFGLAIVGARIYSTKHQTRRQSRNVIPLRVSMDQQKAYQVMVRAARLNETCSVTRRVPVIRSSQHHDGAISWPILSLT
ncbi:hypothetical protein IHE45_05G055900 [Dioscorea alata]|uniref:Uncharacterized protein n=1 Tax=Dioscorea alata TaxID=55571 RepID=A0ACB7W1U1_DIOAL|nr:hypothetical protein IHE45_05G055900 [Dioscorea alata]